MASLRSLLSLVTTLAVLFTYVTAAPSSALIDKRAAVLPSVDPFYQPPAEFENQAPGAILRQRKIVASYFGLVPDVTEAWQLLYRTQSINGTAIADVTTVFKPANAKEDRFVSFQVAYDGSAESGVCDPSFNFQLGAPQIDLISSVEFFLLEAFVMDGYIVSASDYEGPDAAFGAGRLSGTGTLDSMRAVINFKKTLGFTTDSPSIVGYGYSGGGIATGWAASLQPTYAPELNIKGWASGGTPANLTGVARHIDGTAFAGFLPAALTGIDKPSSYMAELQPVYDQLITPAGRVAVAVADQVCGTEQLFTFAFQVLQSTEYNTLGDQLLYQPTLRTVLGRNTMGQVKAETPTAPVYLFHASQDEVIPYLNATTLYNEWCGYGANVQFVTYANGGHATTEVIGFPEAFEFVEAAFAGTVPTGCSMRTELTDTLNPVALGVELEPVLVQLLNALAAAGRKDANVIANPAVLNETIS